ncbi:MAG: hypothetical protein K0R07_563 [Sedimentibacter sp.]|nr:hypothetical protein [Sedimentibacter sp.]
MHTLRVMEGKDYVIKSHSRCKDYDVEYSQIYSNKILDEKELFHVMEINRELVLAAAPIMNKIYDFVKGSNFFSILTDKDGCILNVIGDEDILSEAFSFKMIPGAYMNEKNIGTNAMGTAIAEKEPLQVSGEEHYISAYHRWTCSASPIRDTEGNIIGSIDLTGYSELVHIHTLGMVVAAADAIEKKLQSNSYKAMLFREKRYYEAVQDSLLSGIIITSFDGKILSANSTASELFGYDQDELKQMKAYELLKEWNRISKLIYEKKDTFIEDVDVYARKNIQQLNLNAYLVKDEDNENSNILLMFHDVKKQRKQAQNIMGRHAVYTFDKIVGKDEGFLAVVKFAKKIADSRSNILILGDSGTGKELFAHSIHNYSPRAKEPFIVLNCGAIPRNLIESELFGYEEGAFTGAKTKGNPGKFEIADGGTIFLDEIGEMPIDLQTRLLRVIEEGTVCRIGSTQEKVVNVRVIAATNKDLKEEVQSGTFRKDLYYRLNVLPIRLPSLCERRGDIKLLVEYFMDKISKKLNKKSVYISVQEMEKLTSYDWPGNIRELENYIELVVNTESIPDINNIGLGKIDKKYINHEIEKELLEFEPCSLSLKDVEREHIVRILNVNDNNMSRTAQVLGIGRNTLYRKLKEHNISC